MFRSLDEGHPARASISSSYLFSQLLSVKISRMSLIEALGDARTALGVRREFPKLNRLALTLLVMKSLSHVRKHESIIDGFPLPTEGPFILTGNHRADDDNYKACVAGVRAGRLIRPILKKGLVVRGFQESQAYLQSIEAEESLQYDTLMAFVLRGVGSTAIDREHLDATTFMKQTGQILRSQILGIFIQPHRYPDGGLRHLQLGPAILAMRHPTILIAPFTSSGTPDGVDKFTIHQPFTYREKVKEYGRKLSGEEFTMILADIIAGGLPERPRNIWLNGGRDLEIQRLASLRKIKPH